MDASQWSQQQVASLPKQMDEITSPTPTSNNNPRGNNATQQQSQERRTRPQKDQIINCPRCNSTNTKFCYYNNYSLTQPRYFCKACRRYWTQGGSLRSVPVGGGSRKNKRSSSMLSSSSLTTQVQPSTNNQPQMHNNSKLIIPDLNPPTSLSHLLTSSQNPNNNMKFLEGHDLNLAFPIQGLFHHHIDHQQHHQLPKIEGNNNSTNNENHNNNNSTPTTTNNSTTSTPISALELLRSGIASRVGNLNTFVPMTMPNPSALYQSGYPNLQEFKPSMNFFQSPNEHNNMTGSNNDDDHHNSIGGGGERLLFPITDMNSKLATNNTHEDQIDEQSNKGNGNDDHHHHSGYWNGMLGGGTW